MRPWVKIVIAAIVIVLIPIVVVSAVILSQGAQMNKEQSEISGFYLPPEPLPQTPGQLLRSEPLGVEVSGGTGYRILYVSQRPDGTPAASSGMVFIPDSPAPAEGRPVIAWAHGTLGMGDACAPSRSSDPLSDTEYWLSDMLERGWLVTATDYVGLGTPGPELYLVAEAEARDVVNSVRAAAQLPDAHTGSRYAVWGHSQGGHSALWTGHLSAELAPELSLIAVAAAAPAAQLADIMGAQWKGAIGWGIGPEVAVSWPIVDPRLSVEDILTGAGLRNYERLANECLNNDDALLIELAARQALGQSFFTSNPVKNASWKEFADAQTPPPLPASMPTLIAQSMADQVVLAWPNAVTQEKWCAAGSDLTMVWLGVVNHQKTAMTAGPSVVSWLEERFAGKPTQPNCAIPPPVARP